MGPNFRKGGSGVAAVKLRKFTRNLPFGSKNGTDHTLLPLFADSVQQFSYGPPPTVARMAHHAQCQRPVAGESA